VVAGNIYRLEYKGALTDATWLHVGCGSETAVLSRATVGGVDGVKPFMSNSNSGCKSLEDATLPTQTTEQILQTNIRMVDTQAADDLHLFGSNPLKSLG
jgi:hypothetical protein